MLASAHRITRGEDFRRILRRGSKHPTRVGLIAASPGETSEARFGIVVSRAVGGAVVRNRIKRRIRAVCSGWTGLGAWDVVIRVDPAAIQLSPEDLKSAIGEVLGTLGRR